MNPYMQDSSDSTSIRVMTEEQAVLKSPSMKASIQQSRGQRMKRKATALKSALMK